MLTISQLTGLMRNKPRYTTPVIASGGVVAPLEILEGDTLSITNNAVVTAYPPATVTSQIHVNGANVGTSYTAPPGSSGSTVQVLSKFDNGEGQVLTQSTAVTVTPAVTFPQLGYLGGNVEATIDYTLNPLFLNAIFDARGFGYQNTYTGSPLTGGTTGVANAYGGTLTFASLYGANNDGQNVLVWATGYINNCNPFMNTTDDVGRVITLNGSVFATVTAASTIGVAPTSVLVGGTGYTNGTYTSVALTGGTGSGATATLVVAGGVVTSFTITNPGSGYTSADQLSASGLGAGTGFHLTVALGSAAVVSLPQALTTLTYSTPTSWSILFPRDANGWPLQKCENVLTSSPGQLPPGTYHCTITWTTGKTTPVVSLSGSGALAAVNYTSGIVTVGSVCTQTFDLVVSGTVILEFSAGFTFLDIPRDGSTTSVGKVPFNPDALTYYSRFYSLRFMDYFATNGNTQTEWVTRVPNYNTFMMQKSWETWIDFCNALHDWPGSKLQKVWLNLPGLCSNDYASHVVSLLNTWNSGRQAYAGLNTNLTVFIEVGNEPWNFAFTLWGNYITLAVAEMQLIGNYQIPSTIASLTLSGTTVTVNCTGVKPAFVVNGASMIASTSAQTWQGVDSQSNVSNLANPTIISNVTTGLDVNSNPIYSFTYPTNQASAVSYSNWAAVFNLSSTLVADATVNATPGAAAAAYATNIYNSTYKWMVRRVHDISVVWHAVRASDRFVLNLQQYGAGSGYGVDANESATVPGQYPYGLYLDSLINSGSPALSNWLYGVAIAPYFKADTFCSAVGNTNTLISVPTAAGFLVGDQVIVANGNTARYQIGTNSVSSYLLTMVTNINGLVVTMADACVVASSPSAGTSVMVVTPGGSSTAVAGSLTTGGVTSAGGNTITFLTALPAGLTVGDQIAVNGALGNPLYTTIAGVNQIVTVSQSANGTGYTSGTYTSVALTGGTGSGATANITVSGGSITATTLTYGGSGYTVGDVLGVAAANVGGTGSGFACNVTAVKPFVLADFSHATLTTARLTVTSGAANGTTTTASVTQNSVWMTATVPNLGVGDAVTVYGAGSPSLYATVTAVDATHHSLTINKNVAPVVQVGAGLSVTLACPIINAGSGYTDGYYSNIGLTGGTGTAITVNIVVSGGSVVSYSPISNGGTGFTVGDVLTGTFGGGSGFQIQVQAGFGNTFLYMQGNNPVSYAACNAINMTNTAAVIRAHVAANRLYGTHPVAYEGGPDTQQAPLYDYELHTSTAMGTTVTLLLDTWFQNGGEEFHFFTLGPASTVDYSLTPVLGTVNPGSSGGNGGTFLTQNGWAATSSFANVSAPKLAALLAYSRVKTYQNVQGAPGDLTMAHYQGSSAYTQPNMLTNPTNPGNSIWWTSNIVDRWVTWLAAIPRRQKYQLVLWGTSALAGVSVNLYVDNVLIGSCTLVQNGAGSTATVTMAACANPPSAILSSGVRLVKALIPANTGGTTEGMYKISLVPTA